MSKYLCEEDMNTGEFISRDEALKAMQYCCENCDNYNGAMCRACDNADEMDIICDIPAADVQPIDKWISVEDRLPEEIGYYLVVIGNEMLVSIDIAEYSENHWHKHDKVMFWQPLPDYPKTIKG